MIRPAVKYGLEALGVLLTAMTLLMAFAVWRIAAGPVPLGFLNETIIERANAELEQGSLTLEDTVLLWVPDDRQLVISLVGAQLRDAAGEPMVTIPEIRIDVRVRSLLRGVVSLQEVELVGVDAAIVRRPGTGVELALAERDPESGELTPKKADTNIGLEALMVQLAEPPDPNSLLGSLQSFGMRNASLRFIDEVNDVEWKTEDATLVLSRDLEGVSAFFDAVLELGEARLDLQMQGSAPAGADRVVFQAKGSGFVPAALARASPFFSDFAVLDAPLSGSGTVTIGENGVWLGAELELVSGAGHAVIAPLGDEPLPVDEIVADVELDPVINRLYLRKLDFAAGENSGTLSGEATYDQPDGFHIAGATVALNAEDLALHITDFTDGIANIDSAAFAGRLDFDNLTADISALTLRVGEGVLALSGRVEDHAESPLVQAQGEASNIRVDRLGDIWPKPLAKGAREWFTENVSTGLIESADVSLDLAGGMIAAADRHEALPMEVIDLTFTMSGATVRYLDEMPPLQRVRGRGHLQGDRYDTWVDGAFIDVGGNRLQVNNGRFTAAALHIEGGPGEVQMNVTGATATILALLDHEPLGFISRYGMDPATVGGYGEVEATLTLPLRKTVTMDDVDFSGRAIARDVGLPNVFADVSLDGGELVVDVERNGLSAYGQVTLNGVETGLGWKERFVSGEGPSSTFELAGMTDDADRKALGLDLASLVNGPVYSQVTVHGSGPNLVDGTVEVELRDAVLKQETIGWQKPAGSPAEGRFDLAFEPEGRVRLNSIAIQGPEIGLSGMVLMSGEGDLLEAVLPETRLGAETLVSFTAARQENGVLEMHAEGPKFDARGVLTNLFSGEPETAAEDDVQAAAEADDTNIALTARFPTTLAHGGVRVSNVDVDLLVLNGETQRLVVTGDVRERADFMATISPTPEGRRTITASASDAGAVLRGIDFYDSFRGGKLDVAGTFDDLAPGAPLSGKVMIDDFRVVDAPVLANILTVGSLTGLSDTLQGDGIRFVKLDLPFRMTAERFHVEEGRMSGPAFGLTIKGQVDRVEGQFDLNGTIVPAYTINSILGNVPILGDIIVGREGEGIFAVTYAVRGTRDKPVITVNPLAALAPGFLRRIFEFGEVLPPEELAPQDLPTASVPESAQESDGRSPPPAQ
ncbi:MAG: AsmA-like C-terminal domain-containing protein [Parvibaculaceae bacterium]